MFEIPAPGLRWRYFDPVPLGGTWLVQLGPGLWGLDLYTLAFSIRWLQPQTVVTEARTLRSFLIHRGSQSPSGVGAGSLTEWSPVLPHVELDSLFSIGAETLSASACCRPTAQRLAAAARSLTCFHSISHPQRCLQWVCGQLCVLNVLFATVTYHDDESGTMPPCLDLSLCFLPGGINGIPSTPTLDMSSSCS